MYIYIIYDSLDAEQDEALLASLAGLSDEGPIGHTDSKRVTKLEKSWRRISTTSSGSKISTTQMLLWNRFSNRGRTPWNTYRNKHQAEKRRMGPSLSCQSQDISCRVVSNSGRSLGSKFPSPSCIGYRYCSARTLCYDLRCIALGYRWRTGRSWAWFLSKDSSTIPICKVFVVSDICICSPSLWGINAVSVLVL